MSKVVKYLVSGVPVGTLREVSEMLDRKITKAMILAGEVPEVAMDEDDIVENEVADDDGVARIYKGDGEYEEIPLTNPLQHNTDNIEEDVDMKSDNKTSLITEDEEKLIEEIVNSTDDTEELEDVDSYVDEHTDNGEIEDDIPENNEEEDTNEEEDNTPEDSEDVPEGDKMSVLLAKMKALNAKKAQEGAGTTTSGKSKRTKTIEFTGEYPEVGFFKEKKQLQKFYKQLTDDQLNDWIELEGLTYKESDNEPINRMRKCMAILSLHFPPETKTSSKKKSKYADLKTEDLLEIALENDIDVQDGKGNPAILRMYTIMALRKAGLLE